MGDDWRIWLLLGILFAIVLLIASQEDLPYDEEDEFLEEEIEHAINWLYEEEELFDGENEHS